jgi:hypothetical protein
LINLGSQQVNAIEIKSLYEQAFVQRITSRVEALIPPENPEKEAQALVVIGELPPFESNKYIRYPTRTATSNTLETTAFAPYRQIEILNFFLGHEAARKPTEIEQKLVINQSRNVHPWPATNSTFIIDNTIAVVLQPYKPGTPITWHQQR